MSLRLIKVDFVELFANIIDGEFFEWVHHFPYGPGRSLSASGGLVRLWRGATSARIILLYA